MNEKEKQNLVTIYYKICPRKRLRFSLALNRIRIDFLFMLTNLVITKLNLVGPTTNFRGSHPPQPFPHPPSATTVPTPFHPTVHSDLTSRHHPRSLIRNSPPSCSRLAADPNQSSRLRSSPKTRPYLSRSTIGRVPARVPWFISAPQDEIGVHNFRRGGVKRRKH